METSRRAGLALCATLLTAASALSAYSLSAYTITDAQLAALEAQAENEPRERGTQGDVDWRYTLPEGVTTRQATFYSDETGCYAKLFFPPGFDPSKKYPGIVLGHGTNAISIAMEKYGSRFAAAGMVAMAIDYRGYGFSDPWVRLIEPDPTMGSDQPTDERTVERTARVELKRTRLLVTKQAEDYRAAISYLQGEPGVDPERIGIWGSSLSGGVVFAVAGMDARVKAIVAQVPAVSNRVPSGPLSLSGPLLEDAIQRARTGEGGEYLTGFSIRGYVDTETRQVGREQPTGAYLSRIPDSTAVLFLPAEKDELIRLAGVKAVAESYHGTHDLLVVPYVTHFQMYSGAAFEVSSAAAAEWFAQHLGGAR